MGLLRKLFPSRAPKVAPVYKVTPKEGAPQASIVRDVSYRWAIEGSTCTYPTPEALATLHASKGPIRMEDLPQCGKKAVYTVLTTFENTSNDFIMHYCEEHRPPQWPKDFKA